jgi:DNA-binding ferritin-like protein
MKEELITKLVQIQTQFRFMHWQTTFDAKHKAYGKVYDKMGDLIDDFVEGMMGKYGRPSFESEFSIMFQDLESMSLQNFVDGVCDFLISISEQLDSKTDTDLLNLRDEMLLLINKLKYLLTLKY